MTPILFVTPAPRIRLVEDFADARESYRDHLVTEIVTYLAARSVRAAGSDRPVRGKSKRR